VQSSVKIKHAFGRVLFTLREEKGASQKEVADNCDLERAYVSRLERGLLQPTITTVIKLAEYFNVSPGDIVNQVYSSIKKKK